MKTQEERAQERKLLRLFCKAAPIGRKIILITAQALADATPRTDNTDAENPT